MAEKYDRNLFITPMDTSEFQADLISSLKAHLAPRITTHGVLVEVYGEGVLLMGDSGIGKSETALELIKRGHRLIADDAVDIKRISKDELVGSAPELIRYYMELRGIGVINVRHIYGVGAVKPETSIDLVVKMERWEEGKAYDRLGLSSETYDILGVTLPQVTIPVRPGRNLAVIMELAAMNNRQKKMGFNAAEALVRVRGVMVHPGSAKNVMVNAITVAAEFDQLVPAAERPEHTSGREGFFHPTAIRGTASEVTLSYIVRDHDSQIFSQRQQTLKDIAAFLNKRYGEGTVTVTLHEQYRNMAEAFGDCPFLIDNALAANREAGVEPQVIAVRGGTDGSQLSLRGLPCPNIATGGYNAHSVREFIPVSSLETTVDILQNLVAKFAVPQTSGKQAAGQQAVR